MENIIKETTESVLDEMMHMEQEAEPTEYVDEEVIEEEVVALSPERAATMLGAVTHVAMSSQNGMEDFGGTADDAHLEESVRLVPEAASASGMLHDDEVPEISMTVKGSMQVVLAHPETERSMQISFGQDYIDIVFQDGIVLKVPTKQAS